MFMNTHFVTKYNCMEYTSENFFRGQTQSIPQLLDEYKQTGCTLLLVGDVPDDVLNTVSGNLLGDPELQPRTRVFGLFDRSEQTVHDRLDHAGYGRTPTRVVTTTDTARHTCHPEADGGTTSSPSDTYIPDRSLEVSHATADDLTAVATMLDNQIADANSNYDASELRVCIDSLRPVLDTYATAAVDSFLDTMTSAITERRGMGHFVLPVSRTHDAVTQISDHFDILVPLRSANGTAEQRWEFPAEGRETDWLEL